MNSAAKQQAETLLRQLCLGTQIVGVRWRAFAFTIVLERSTPDTPSPRGVPGPPERRDTTITAQEVDLVVESRWTVFPARPEHFPKREEELPDLALEERVSTLARLAGQDIVDVALGEQEPHLILTFASGSVLFLNGRHDKFECWNLGTIGAAAGSEWLIVTVPGGDLAIFAPQTISSVE